MRKLFTVIAALMTAVLLSVSVGAFDANDYDYGGNDWGSSWDDDDDYSWGGSSYDDDDDYHSHSGSGGSNMTWEETLITVAFVAVCLIAGGIWASKPLKSDKKHEPAKPSGGSQRPKQVMMPNRNVEIRDAVRQVDPSFTYEGMLDRAKKVFVDIQNAWCAKNLEPVRGVMHNNLYSTTSKQVQAKIDQHVTYHYENITIKNAYLTSYVRDSEYEYVTVYLNTEYIDYQTDDNTGKIIRGDTSTMWKMRYLMKFMRSVGGASAQSKFCPNCGAPLDISSSGKCEYCGSTVTTGSFDWLLSDFTTVRQDTKDDGIRI